ncbi:MAG TPA: VIT1/CCC1 transporter family protein [Chitinophagales bacterium]|nr:VIT1/CCC1 transporter family protein [Chitinophagales bacterium]HNM32532.1 VIT1/CCC1 transporter family protein [Chitinophagales bacterium]
MHLHPEVTRKLKAHHEEHVKSSDTIKDIVIGMSDGLTVPFALAAGLSGAVASSSLVITAGIAEIAAGSIAMGLGGYLAGRAEIDHYNAEQKREAYEVDNLRANEIAETQEILSHLGLSEATVKIATEEIAKDKEKWVQFMMKYELDLETPDPKRARNSAFTIGVSYIVGGIIPLSPYFFAAHPHDGLIYSVIVTLISLFIFGYYKSKLTGQPVFKGAIKVTAIGAIAAAAAFGIAKLFA